MHVIFNALKNTKTGKACGVDGFAAEHFIYANKIIHIYLSFLYNCFISHGYLPRDFMKTAIGFDQELYGFSNSLFQDI